MYFNALGREWGIEMGSREWGVGNRDGGMGREGDGGGNVYLIWCNLSHLWESHLFYLWESHLLSPDKHSLGEIKLRHKTSD
jgi:hypothetical protein